MWNLQNFVASISLFLISTATTTSAISSEYNWLSDESVQEVLTNGYGGVNRNSNEKILQKIINTVTQYASDCHTQKNILIDLSLEGIAPDIIHLDLGSRKAALQDISVSELPSIKRKLYSSSIQCESTRSAKMEVKLPNDLEINATFIVGKHKNATDSETTIDESFKGSISIILKNVSISKQFFIRENYNEEIKWEIHYSKSVVSVDVAQQFQIPIYNKQQAIIDKMESSIKLFLIRKFNAEFIKRGNSVADICSKFMKHKDPYTDIIDDYDYIYVMPNFDMSDIAGLLKSTGPILIDGLSLFNNTELTVSENKASSSDGNGPSYDDPEIKEITVKIKTNDLKGRAKYSLNSKPFAIIFDFEFIEFKVKKRNVFQYENKNHPHGSYAKLNTSDVDLQVSINLGQMKAKTPNIDVIKHNISKSEVISSHAILLKDHIHDLLTKSLNEKINRSLFANCP